MPFCRTLVHLMLVLVVLAGGVVPAAAMPVGGAGAEAAMADGGMAENCHDLAGDQASPRDTPPADCCERGCACDCLNPLQAGLLAAPPKVSLAVRDADASRFAGALSSTAVAPDVRPPIA